MKKLLLSYIAPFIKYIWEKPVMQKGIIPAGFLSGIASLSYWGWCFLIAEGCSSVNTDYLKALQPNIEAVGTDYGRHLKHPDNPRYVKFRKIDTAQLEKIPKKMESLTKMDAILTPNEVKSIFTVDEIILLRSILQKIIYYRDELYSSSERKKLEDSSYNSVKELNRLLEAQLGKGDEDGSK